MSFEKFAEVTKVSSGYDTISEMILTQYQAMLVQKIKPSPLSADPEASKAEEISKAMKVAQDKISSKLPDYLAVLKSTWMSHISDADLVKISEAFDSEILRSYFDVSKKVEADLKVSMQPFVQKLFQSILEQSKS